MTPTWRRRRTGRGRPGTSPSASTPKAAGRNECGGDVAGRAERMVFRRVGGGRRLGDRVVAAAGGRRGTAACAEREPGAGRRSAAGLGGGRMDCGAGDGVEA